MKRMIFLFIVFLFVSCSDPNESNTVLDDQQEQLMREANRQIGVPAITNFTERKLSKMLLEERDKEDLICYAYIISEFSGKPIYLGKCIGYGLPYSTQYTNPTTVKYKHGGWVTLPQADPNGLFMPNSSEATWIFLIDSTTNKPRPVYCEARLLISPFKLGNQ